MVTHNIHFNDKIRKCSLKYPLIFVFLSYRKNFLGTQKQFRISHSKREIGVRVIEVLLYIKYDILDPKVSKTLHVS